MEGSGVVGTRERAFLLSHGDLLILPPGCPYTFEAPEEDGTYLIVNYDYTQEASHICEPIPPVPLCELREEDLLSPVVLIDEPSLNEPFFLGEMYKLTELFLRLEAILSHKIVYYEREASALLETVLLECLRARRLGALPRGRSSVGAVLDYLHKHYATRLCNRDVAEALGYHPNYVSELVKRATGLSLHRYLTAVRIRRAVELLEEGELSVGEIAEACGFCDIYHFSRTFKGVTGAPPTRYRR